MQFPSPPLSPMSTGSTTLYYPARVLCDTDGTLVDLADLYHHQQQLAICSVPPRTQPITQMSSNGSYNISNELPNKSPIQLPPQPALTPAPIALSPCTIETTLCTQPDINATLLRSITNGLLQTIANHKADTAITTKAYEDQLHGLEQCVLHYEGTFDAPPEGFTLNHRQVTSFHIPIGDGLYQEAKWICLNNDGTVLGYSSTQGPNEQPYIINLYAEADTSTNSPIKTLLVWFQHMLTGPGGDFQILQTTVADTNDWGLACEIMQYREIDDNITTLVVKLEGYQRDIDATWASLMSCESCLVPAHAIEHVEPLHNVARKPRAICSG